MEASAYPENTELRVKAGLPEATPGDLPVLFGPRNPESKKPDQAGHQ